MADELNEQKTIRSYLLGQLSDDQAERVEIRCMTDRRFAEEVSILEDEVVDEYLYGELPEDDRQYLESTYLATREGRQHLAFAAAFGKYVTSSGGRHAFGAGWLRRWASSWASAPRLPRFVAAVAMVGLLAALCGLLLLKMRSVDRDVNEARATLADVEQRNDDVNRLLATERSSRLEAGHGSASQDKPSATVAAKAKEQNRPGGEAAGALAMITLQPGKALRSDGKPNYLNVPPTAKAIRITLTVPEGIHYNVYRATLRMNGQQGNVLPDSLKEAGSGRSRSIVITLPATLDNGDYSLKVYGDQPSDPAKFVAAYAFRLAKRKPA